MATTTRLSQGTAVTLMTTELNSLANGTGVVSSVNGSSGVFTSTSGGGTTNLGGYLFGKFELVLAAPAAAFSAGAVNVWFLQTVDGTNYEDGSASLTPKRPPDLTFYPQATASAQRIVVTAPLPVGAWKVLVLPLGLGSGAVLASSGNTLKVIANTTQSA
jgi:hypothetical protein